MKIVLKHECCLTILYRGDEKMNVNSMKRYLLEDLEKIKIVDCHSHTISKSEYYENAPYDLFRLESYFRREIASINGKNIFLGAKTDYERWLRLKGVLKRASNVSYWRHNIHVYKSLFNLEDEEITEENWEFVNDKIKEKTKDPDWYDYVTEDICKLETQVRNIDWFESWEDRYFKAVLRMEPALLIHKEDVRKSLEINVNRDIQSLSTFKEALDELLGKYKKLGIVGIKLAHAYFRTLSTEYVSEKDASVYFQKIVFKGDTTPEYIKLFQDHIIYFLGEIALKYNLIFQIHTGLQDNWINIPYSDPLLLIDLIKSFPGVCFDLFHTGYPYSRNMGILAKHYPNVWINMAWIYLVSLSASKQILSEYIDLVPAYRILAFGSDVDFPEMILGHLTMAKNCVGDVLAEKVENGTISENLAFDLIKMMFRENALQLYSQNVELISRPEDQDYHWFKVAGKHVKLE